VEIENLVSRRNLLIGPGVLVVLSVVALAAFGFNTSSSAQTEGFDSSAGASVARDAPLPGPETGATDTTERRRAVSVDLSFEVGDVGLAVDSAASLARESGGFVEDEELDRSGRNTGGVEARVPDGNASGFLRSLEGREGWSLESRNRRVEDLTASYTETELELENKRQELRRLEELVNQTGEVSTLVDLQERMSEVRSRVQFLEQRLETLRTRTSFTEFTVRFEEPATLSTSFELDESLNRSYQAFFDSVEFLVVAIGWLLPVALLLLVGYGVYRGALRLRGRQG
jgi:polyhydroxyalkanoate synthesis regulator phasin